MAAVVRRDVATCGLADSVGEAKARARVTGLDACVVVNERRIVFGLLEERELNADANMTAEQAMRGGPTTYRLDDLASETAARMRERDVDLLTITTPDGTLVGLVRREDVERAGLGS